MTASELAAEVLIRFAVRKAIRTLDKPRTNYYRLTTNNVWPFVKIDKAVMNGSITTSCSDGWAKRQVVGFEDDEYIPGDYYSRNFSKVS